MQQYLELKSKLDDTLLFFQVGDFFELFFDDAVQAAAFLNITLTKRGQHQGQPIPLCGVPSQALDVYLTKLVKGGFRVAICEQLDPAVPGKVVRRGITRVLTPGTLVEESLLDEKSASYFCSFFPMQTDWGILFGELLTTQIFATVVPAQAFKTLESELARFFPDEIVLPHNKFGKQLHPFFKSLGYATTFQKEAESYDLQKAQLQEWLRRQFQESVQQKLQHVPALYGALNGFYTYLNKCQQQALSQFTAIKFYEPDSFLILDAATQNHLELIRNSDDGGRQQTVLDLIDKSQTPMGARMLKKWLMRPLNDLKAIGSRQDAIEVLLKHLLMREKLGQLVRQVADLERVVGRIALDRGVLLDYLQLKRALGVLPELKELLKTCSESDLLTFIEHSLVDLSCLHDILSRALNDDLGKEWLIKAGFNSELDQIRDLVLDASQKFIDFEQQQQRATGINSLKVRFNSVQGYYIEITKSNLHLVPSNYLRQQTLVGKERFITLELQQLQIHLEQARQNINTLEDAIFDQIKAEVGRHVQQLRKISAALANLDALLGLTNVAYEYGYVRPKFNEKQEIIIEEGRHPVVEQALAANFIPNDTKLVAEASLWIITGPNMGGKSTYLRQVALICIMAQCGSFVPAKSANLPILDRIFTRIGASDNLARGKSTFLVEMEETATICRQATKRSLVILDEVGRGTSTFDGLAIAQAVVEYVYTQVGARCLFATHYHELTNLADQFAAIVNYYAASKQAGGEVVLLHKIVPGVADGSFGVQAARQADLPDWIIQRAQVLLQELVTEKPTSLANVPKLLPSSQNALFFKAFVDQIDSLDLENMTPRQCWDFLWKMKQELL